MKEDVYEKMESLIEKRAALQKWEDCGSDEIEKTEREMIEVLSGDEKETIRYIRLRGYGVTLEYIVELSDEINARLKSKKFTEALKKAAEKNYKFQMSLISEAERGA